MPNDRYRSQRGFTLTEAMITVAIVGILGLVVVKNAKPSNLHTNAALRNATLPVVSKAFRVLHSSDASPADAIAAGLPPDARGKVEMSLVACSSLTGEDKEKTAKMCGMTGDNSMRWLIFKSNPGVVSVRLEMLRAGGTFERISTSFMPWYWDTPFTVMNLYVAPDAFITSGAAGCPNGCATATTLPAIGTSFQTIQQQVGQPGPKIYCYANGTCDPVTYFFHVNDVKTNVKKLSRIAVTATGAITPFDTW